MKHLSCKDILKELGPFSLQKRRLRDDLSVSEGEMQERRGQTL